MRCYARLALGDFSQEGKSKLLPSRTHRTSTCTHAALLVRAPLHGPRPAARDTPSTHALPELSETCTTRHPKQRLARPQRLRAPALPPLRAETALYCTAHVRAAAAVLTLGTLLSYVTLPRSQGAHTYPPATTTAHEAAGRYRASSKCYPPQQSAMRVHAPASSLSLSCHYSFPTAHYDAACAAHRLLQRHAASAHATVRLLSRPCARRR
jgi:hypothetical protein